ncbi:hypothetical protein M407DRAFT_27866 [Tulasnella calospora MUT 4182]|uniref:Uncharacterized protein n=1 Tax=Tulasnella calospora MUT 4182 TaxID=1051891 RepID=A0A0C3QD28_9AGAM|nr:hypothetical protein M407DRAFT_27866 [Tulasnella calospora MUT 4182]
MVQSLLKSLFLYSALAASAVLAAPAHQPQSDPIARGVSPREYLHSPRQLAARLTTPIPGSISRRSKDEGGRVKKVTNAMRIAKGYRDLIPAAVSTAEMIDDGSRAGSAHKARSSPVPPITMPAILVYGSNGRSGTPLGYLSLGVNVNKVYYVTTDCTKAMVNPQLSSGALINPAQPQEYSSVGITSNNQVLGTDSWNYAYLSATAATPYGSPPVTSKYHSWSDGSDKYIESGIWSVGTNNELIPTWINPNGDTVKMEIGYFPGALTLVTGNLAMVRQHNLYDESSAPQIRFFIADQFNCAQAPA